MSAKYLKLVFYQGGFVQTTKQPRRKGKQKLGKLKIEIQLSAFP
jgi:hypothetical protein